MTTSILFSIIYIKWAAPPQVREEGGVYLSPANEIPRTASAPLDLDIDGLARAPDGVHHPLDALLDQARAFLHVLGQRGAAGVLLGVDLVVAQDDLVDVQAGHARGDALPEDVGGELVGAVHDERDLAQRRLADRRQPREVQVDVLHAVVGPVDVADRRRQKVNARRDELQRFFRRRQDPFQIPRVLHAGLAAVDAAGLGLRRDAQVVAVLDQLRRAGQILLLLVVRHVHHDRVELARLRRLLDRLLALRVVQVQTHGHFGTAAHVRRQVDQVVVGIFLCPGEQEDLAGGVLRLGGFPARDDGFQVVAHHAGDAVVAFLCGLEDSHRDVL